jgi:NAD(P)-dependent dehydrogenase (short-subunit alcohol dehydrogenase family)
LIFGKAFGRYEIPLSIESGDRQASWENFMGEWEAKVILVTGAAGGIGKATVKRFLENQAVVFASDVNAAALNQSLSNMSVMRGTVHKIIGDVAKVADCERIVATAVNGGGRLDVVVNSAGVWVEGPSDTMTEAMWDRTMDINLKGTFFINRYAIPELEKTRGAIVNISSNDGLTGDPEAAIYCASKGGVCLMTKSLAIELAPRGIRVNAVCPGDVMTGMLEGQAQMFGGGDPQGYLKKLLAYYPQGEKARFIHPHEVAETVYFLASTKAAPITGVCLAVDFGATAGL